MRKILIPLIFGLISLDMSAQLPGLSVKPVRLFYTLLNGQYAIQTVYIVNNTGKDQQFKLYLEDWMRDSSGGHLYMPPGICAQSCARWVTLNKQFIELKAGEMTNVMVKVQVPDSALAIEEMKWTMLFIENTAEKISPSITKGFNTAVNNVTRIGVHIVQTPPSIIEKNLKLLSFNNLQDNRYRIVCQNTGKIQFDCKSYLELSSVETGKKITIPKNVFPLFPNQTRYVDFKLPETLDKGKYTVVGVLDAGDDIPLMAAELTIEKK